MTSFRPAGDKAWNYVRESPKLSPFLKWIKRSDSLFECTVMPGWPAKVATNQPDGSYATKDLFEPHPTIEKAWKYIARLDDTIALVNGEKFNPVMMEGTIRSHKAVTETVVFGNGRPYLGILVVPSPAVQELSQDEVVDQIWPVIDDANRDAEAYARISREMITVLPPNCEFPRTDKGSVIRQAFYKQFNAEIEHAYDQAAAANGNLRALSATDLEVFLRNSIAKFLPQVKDVERSTDLFSLGLDSLQSIQIRNDILKNINISGQKLGQNVVFEHPSIAALSGHLYNLRTGQAGEYTSTTVQMQNLIERYSIFAAAKRKSVALTGATGSLGAHVLAQLAARPEIKTVYCLVRASTHKDASQRVRESLVQRKIYHTMSLGARRKIHALASDLADPFLGLGYETHELVAQSLQSVIHCAWSVNFNKSLQSFEKDCVPGVHNLLNLCLAASDEPASFDFCSSVSTVAQCPDLHIPEQLAKLEWAQNMGYAQSKCVAEHLCMAAAEKTGVKTRVLRVGQIVADTTHGVWNATEAIPLIMQSALTIGALPKLQESPSWTPVDVIAKAIVEISLSDAGSIVANVTNAKTFSWTNDLLPALKQGGLQFEEVEPKEWVERLRASNSDALANPPIKLVDFFASKYSKDTFSPSRTYETNLARTYSPSLAAAPVLDATFVKTFLNYFLSSSWQQTCPTEQEAPRRCVTILCGPCGSGKSTIARTLSTAINSYFIEGDELHTSSAVRSMASGIPLDDAARVPWLNQIKQRAVHALVELGYQRVFVSCSALKKRYREQLRELKDEEGVDVVFLDLQCEKEELFRRMKWRGEHYMKEEMVEGQIAVREESGVEETDVVPVDAGREVGEVVEEVLAVLGLERE